MLIHRIIEHVVPQTDLLQLTYHWWHQTLEGQVASLETAKIMLEIQLWHIIINIFTIM